MSGELYNVRKIMLRGNEISKFDVEVLSNYDDKKTILSSYLVKQLIAKQAAKGVEFDNSIVSEQEMWQIKLTSSDPITDTTVIEQEEGVKMQPILIYNSEGTALDTEVDLVDVKLQNTILYHENYEVKSNVEWSFAEVEDFYKSVYPKQFGSNGEVQKLGLMVVDFSAMNLQQLSEIHIPKLIKVEVPNIHDSYDAHWFIPVAMNTPTIDKDILIDAPSVLCINPDYDHSTGVKRYISFGLNVDNSFISSNFPSKLTNKVAKITTTYPGNETHITYTNTSEDSYTNITLSEPDGYDYETATITFNEGSEPTIVLSAPQSSTPTTLNVSHVKFTMSTNTYEIDIIDHDYIYINDGNDLTYKVSTLGSILEPISYTTTSGTKGTTPNGGSVSFTDEIIRIRPTDTAGFIDCCEIEYNSGSGISHYRTVKAAGLYDSINLHIRVSQFACHYKLETTKSTKLFVETINHHSNPCALAGESKYRISSDVPYVFTHAYIEHLCETGETFCIPKYYATVALEKLNHFYWTVVVDSDTEIDPVIFNPTACVIVPKDSKISVDYTQMWPNCKFNILVLEPSYLFKMQGTLNKPVDRHRYLNMEEYLMELPYRHYNNMLMDSLFIRSYENYDQTYKIVVIKDESDKTFTYEVGAKPLAVTDARTEGKKTVKKYFLATKLVDEKQQVYKLKEDSRLNIDLQDSGIEINLTDGNKGFDVYKTDASANGTIEVPFIDLGLQTVYLDQSSATKTPADATSLTIHCNNFQNDYDPEDSTKPDVTITGGHISAVPNHISSTTDGEHPSYPIPATLRIDESAVGEEIKTADVADKMSGVYGVANPTTLYTLGEAGWSTAGDYTTTTNASGNPLANKFFTKVLVPSEGLENYDDAKEIWRIAFANMLRLPYTVPSQENIENTLISPTSTSGAKYAISNSILTGEDKRKFDEYYISGTGETEKLTIKGIKNLGMDSTVTKTVITRLSTNLLGPLFTGLSDIIDFY